MADHTVSAMLALISLCPLRTKRNVIYDFNMNPKYPNEKTMTLSLKCVTTFVEMYLPDFKTNSFPLVTYGWNGEKYGLWKNVRQVPGNEFLPANRFTATVGCQVQKHGNAFAYSYSVVNQRDSKQKIEQFHIVNTDMNVTSFSPIGWRSGLSEYMESTYFSALSGDTTNN